MYAANAAAGINKFEKESAGAEEIETSALVILAIFLTSGQMVELVMREVEIQTCGKPFVTVAVMTPASTVSFYLFYFVPSSSPYSCTVCVVHPKTSITSSPAMKFVSPIVYGPKSAEFCPRFVMTVTIL